MGVGLAWLLAWNAYDIDTQDTRVVDNPDALIVRRGLPFLLLPGLNWEEIDLGLITPSVLAGYRDTIHNEQHWG